jgi:hypothetical protein
MPEFGEEPIDAIESDRIDAWRAELFAEGGLSARTINKTLVIMHGIVKRAMRVYGLPSNPVSRNEQISGDLTEPDTAS